MSSSGYMRMNSARVAGWLVSSLTSTPNFLAAALIFGIALSPNGDCGARDSASRTWSAS